MKKYLYCSRLPNGQTLHIGFYPDTASKNYRIYGNGSDLGVRYEYLGNAERALKRIISAQIKKKTVYLGMFSAMQQNKKSP